MATATMPPEAQRRGKVDTLFSAEWFDDDGVLVPDASDAAVAAVEPRSSSNTKWILAGVAVVGVLGVGLFAVGLTMGVVTYLVLM